MLPEQCILCDQINPATCGVREGANDKSAGEWFGVVLDELPQVADKLLPNIDYGLNHAASDSKWVFGPTSMIPGLGNIDHSLGKNSYG